MNVHLNDDENAVDYLLGELSEDEQVRLEERFFRDSQLSDLISEVEDDLVDRYTRGELSDRQRRLFERRFLITARRQNKLVFARTLLRAETERGSGSRQLRQTKVGWWTQLATFFVRSRPLLSYSLAAIAMLMLIGGWLAVSEFRGLRREASQINSARIESERQNEQLRREAEDLRRRNDDLAATNQDLERERSEVENQIKTSANGGSQNERSSIKSFLTFILSPGYRSAEGPKPLVLPNGLETVRLQLRLNPADEYSSYQVNLHSASGDVVRSWRNLHASALNGERVLVLSIPAARLKAGQYELSLSGASLSAAVEDLGYYYFYIQKN